MTGIGRAAVGVMLALIVAGCDSVGSVQPVGEVLPEAMSGLGDQLNGVWSGDADESVIFVTHTGGGELRLAGVEWKEDHYAMQEMAATLRVSGEDLIVNLRPDEAQTGDVKEYTFVRIAMPAQDGMLVLYGPNVEAFVAAVEAGELEGEVKREENSKHVRITSEAAALNAFVAKAGMDRLFKAGSPIVLRRVAGARAAQGE